MLRIERATATDEPLDVQAIRADFPILRRQVNGRPLAYLDNAATSQKPAAVLEAMERYYREYNANVHRGIYTLSEEATAAYEQARAKVAAFIGAAQPGEVVFVRNATEAINLVAHSWGRANVGPGDLIVLSEMEHHSNLVPWQILAKEAGAHLEFLPIDDDGRLDLAGLDGLLDRRPKLVSLTHVSNTLGTINPLRELAARAHSAGALVLVDGAQSVPHLPVDVRELGCDFLAFSGHKMLGPTGIGVLWGRYDLLEAMPPFLGGGSMILSVGLRESTYADPPARFEAGTPSIAAGIALGVAVDYLDRLGMAAVRRHERELVDYALRRLRGVPGITIYGPGVDERGGVISFNVGDIHPHDLATIADRFAVAIRAGHHCTQPLMERLGVVATARASFYVYSQPEEVDHLVEALLAAQRIFGA